MKNIFKKNLQRIGFSPNARSEAPSKAPKKNKKKKKEIIKNYKERMKNRYGLKDEEFAKKRKEAKQQELNWRQYKKAQVLEIFKPKNVYVSRSERSDLKHPKMAKAKQVAMKDGTLVNVEFGRMKEWYLFTLKPNSRFIDIKLQAKHDKALKEVRDAQKKRPTLAKGQAEYNQVKGLTEPPVAPQPPTTSTNTTSTATATTADEAVGKQPEEKTEAEKYVANTTDEKHKLFPEAWYRLSISKNRMDKDGLTYWMPKRGVDEEMEDDPEGKYTVTAEKVVEAITSEQKLPDSGVKEPGKTVVESLTKVKEKYQKSCGRDIVFMNTLKGTIEFMEKGGPKKSDKKCTSIQEEPATDGPNQITFAPTITAYVFKGNRIGRQLAKRKGATEPKVEKNTEQLKDYKREAGEDTDGF